MYAFTLKNGFSITHNGYEVLISKDHGMWLFDRQDGEPCITFGTKLYTLEEAIEEYCDS